MSINNSRDLLADFMAQNEVVVTDHIVQGRNLQLLPGTYVTDWDTNAFDSVTFTGSSKGDALFGGGGELFAFFMGTRGNDIYGIDPNADAFSSAYVDYSAAKHGVVVDMSYRGTRTFIDADGETRTVDIVGKAHDGFGGTDYFAENPEEWGAGFSGVLGVFGSSHRDVFIGGGGFDDFYGGGGNDLMIGNSSHGGGGNDFLKGIYDGLSSVVLHGDDGNDTLVAVESTDIRLYGGAGNDVLRGAEVRDGQLVGGDGNDRILAGGGDDGYVIGQAGKDTIDGGDGNDFIDGGVGADVLFSGAGNDTINPDVEYFQRDPGQPRDGARDLVRITAADLGDFADIVLPRSFEEGRDRVDFGAAVRGGAEFRVYHEDLSYNPDTGGLWRPQDSQPDSAGIANTILQVDWNGNGFGAGAPDASDYFLVVIDADLSLRDSHILS